MSKKPPNLAHAVEDEIPQGSFDDQEEFLAHYRPLQRAREALRSLHDDSEFRKGPFAIDVAYALGALEEDIDGGAASALRDQTRGREKLELVMQLLPGIMEVLRQYVKILRPPPVADVYGVAPSPWDSAIGPSTFARGWPPPFPWAGPPPKSDVVAAYEDGCQPIGGGPGPNVTRGWGCHACFQREGGATYNGDHRLNCKVCAHERCGAAADPPPGD